MIAPAQESEAARILEIQKSAFLEEASLNSCMSIPPLLQTLEEIRHEFLSKRFLKYEEKGLIKGSVRACCKDQTVYIERLSVLPEFQGKGIGKALLAAIELEFPSAARFELFTGSRSLKNLSFYAKAGYKKFKEDTKGSLTLIFMEKLLPN